MFSKAYVTLLSSYDYLLAVLVLRESLIAVNSKYPLIVGVIDTLYDKVKPVFDNLDCTIFKIPTLQYRPEVIEKYQQQKWYDPHILNTASKIGLLDAPTEVAVYIDADTMVVQNIDDLFDYPDCSMYFSEREGMGLSGLMVFYPFAHDTNFYRQILESVPCLDGDIFGKLWTPTKTNLMYRIPADYLIDCFDGIDTLLTKNQVKIVHFGARPKPWQSISCHSMCHLQYFNYLNIVSTYIRKTKEIDK